MSKATSRHKARKVQDAHGEEKFRDLMAVTAMIHYCRREVEGVSIAAAILLANSHQVLIAEIEQHLKSALTSPALDQRAA